ncbi:hypothetical protein [Xylophilus ampelinus]|uniref:Uncharacterized protein n=1 Tax=Xylophilus ampelinus TaxID=54067 RepID=A0A318SQ63_9BURK|nr:hypothetical protein [Xylophilus ampelinus]MCS4508880.1 hypothetical protein [Xylophilus ampelinus]PYE79449.1 hypothetical protein DFQ15_102182 [Xylophilus ampelinus]
MQKPDYRKWREVGEACILLATLLASGAGLGYWAGTERMRGMLIEDRQDHLEELQRLQDANRMALQAISGRLAQAAGSTAEAAGVAATAAETAQVAAQTASKAAKAAGVPAAAIEQDRKAINSAIGKANARIGEGAR